MTKQMYMLSYVAENEMGFLPFLFTPTPGYIYPKLDAILEMLNLDASKFYDLELITVEGYLDITADDTVASSDPDVMEWRANNEN
jgi:hypothetical protein